MKVSPYKFASVSRQDVRRCNQLFAKDHDLTFRMGDDIYDVRFEPEGGAPPLKAPLKALIQINDSVGFELCPEERLLNAMIADRVTAQDLKTLSPELRGIVLESAFERILDHIDQLGDNSATIHCIDDNHSPGHNGLQIHFSMIRITDGERSRGYLLTDENGLQWIAGRISTLTANTCRDLDPLPVTGGIEIGYCRLSAREVNRLEPNDIVLAGGTGKPEDREIRIRFSGGPTLGGNLVEPDRLLIQHIITENGESAPMEQTNYRTQEAGDLPVDDITIDLVFEIGRTRMPIGTLKHLQPGYTVQLDASIDRHRPVTIRANGTDVGRGEIVLIDDHLGIRILEFNTPTGSL